jgi:signal transduction histidine kinase
MQPLSRDEGQGHRTAFILGLLLVSLGTTGLLAWQAHYAVTSHRTATESVLRDYAGLAAEEFVRRTAAKVGYEGYYSLVTALAERLHKNESLAGIARDLAAAPDERLRRAASLARRYFVSRPGANALSFGGDAPAEPEVEIWLVSRLAESREKTAPYAVIHGVVASEPVMVVFRADSSAPTLGFQVDLSSLEAWLEAVFEGEPLLPGSLGQGRVKNEALFAAVIDHGGVERFRSPGDYRREFGAERPFGDAYGGVLAGSRVRVSIDPAAASSLVIGGLPRSRLPLLAGLLLLTAGLLATAMLQLRRERALQKLRAEFVASVSHELRTPLTQVRMFAETLLLDRVRSDEERRRSLEILDREVRRLTHLVDNVLQFSRAERGTAALSPEPRELAPTVREALELFQPVMAGNGVRVRTRLGPSVEAVYDPDALRQILLNLLDNALKYGPRAQEIVVGVESRDGTPRLYVDDQGPGVPEKERERIFERFHRIERDRDGAVAGTGIGLAVVRDLLSRQRGRCWVEAGERGGARFVVELPAPRPEEPAAR